MGAVGLGCLVFMISIHSLYEMNIHALPAPSPSPTNYTTLRVGVVWKKYYTEMVSAGKNGTEVKGFCVEVFEEAIKTLNYSHQYITFGNESGTTPSYDDLIQKIVDKESDAVVGDITITANRSQKVVFAQPFLNSGLVAVVRLKHEGLFKSSFTFTKPFTLQLWLIIAAFFICGGLAVYLLERRKNPRFHGQRTKQFGNILMFGFSTWFPNQEDTQSAMGRTVVVACLVVTGILYSCYTANLSAILTAPRLHPNFVNFQSVVERRDTKIAYWYNSFVRDFLINDLGINVNRLIPLTRKEDYYSNLSRGGVDAIIDELPYMESLAATHCSEIALVGQPLTTLNWGFAFDPIHHQQLATNISSRILELTESRELYKIQIKWLPYTYDSPCSDQSKTESGRLQLRQFWGLFAIAGSVTVIIFFLYIVRNICKRSKVIDSGTPRRLSRSGRKAWRRRFSWRLPRNSENSGGLQLSRPPM